MNGRLISVSIICESSILAFSAASFRRCSAMRSLLKSMLFSFLNSSINQSTMRWSMSSPPRCVSPLVDFTSTTPAPTSSTEMSNVPEVGAGVVEVKSTNGDTHLGGDDIDQRIVDWLIDAFKKQHNIDLGKDKMALQRLKDAAEKAKIELSQMMETEINLPFITAG